MEEGLRDKSGGVVILGFSDATLAVVKRGPEEVREQGLLCEHIGMSVCPRVYRFLPDGYEMEILSEPHSRGSSALLGVIAKLSAQVWPRRPYRVLTSEQDWLQPLHSWAWNNGSEWLPEALSLVYPQEPTDGYCLIHGDPALANLMSRKGELVITDPMPRMAYRREIPNRMEVDLGKLVQSAMGWERMLECDSSMWEDLHMFEFLEKPMRQKAVLWGAIHLARIAVRAPKKGRHKIATWAKSTSIQLTRRVISEFS